MHLLQIWKKSNIFAFVLIIGFILFACNGEKPEDDPIDIENLPSLRTDVIVPGHTSPKSFNNITAAELVAQIKIGWNLGNSLDAHDSQQGWLSGTISGMETAWGNPVTTKANIDAIKNAGFNTIRIPVTWYKALDDNFIIREDWLARVTQIVNWAEENDMFILLNTHHDEYIFKFTNSSVNNSLIVFERVWEQIATQFRNYDEKLVFEGLNEPRTKGAEHEWQGGNATERGNLNRHYQVFTDAVRRSGGNNDKRILMVNTYGASADSNAMNGLVIPVDTVPNKIIVSIHAYTPFYFAHENPGDSAWYSNRSQITDIMNRSHSSFVSKGIPVIIGEFGARREKNGPIRDAWAEFYVQSARDKNIPCVLWDDGGNFRLLVRSNNTFDSDSYLNAMMVGAGVR
ncbi:MAG: glycoside hydrolase family 5 protein [Treponema sp.]|nr:glycoside hydrolase family 5 protein [Treponema sp.]MCL2237931.1 glycoside hydrolase family 5 protein [Treponema sp.]